MQIECDFRAYEQATSDVARGFELCCRKLFAEAASDLAVPETAIERVIVTDEQTFGKKVTEVQTALGRKHSYTDNAVHTAVAKTLPHITSGGNVVNTIVIRDFVVYDVCQASAGGSDFGNWDVEPQLYANVIYHEVGHCKDHLLRRNTEELPVYTDKTFKSAEFNRWGASMVLEELAACCHAAITITPQLYAKQVSETNSSLRKQLEWLKNEKLFFRVRQRNLVDMAIAATTTFWLVLREHAKLVGHVQGNTILPKIRPELWRTDDTRLGEIMDGFAAQLQGVNPTVILVANSSGPF